MRDSARQRSDGLHLLSVSQLFFFEAQRVALSILFQRNGCQLSGPRDRLQF